MNADALFQAALTLYQQGRLEQARQLCGQLAAQHPRHAQGRQLLGVLTVQAGDLAQGLAHLREAVALAPTQADGYLTLANCLLQARQPAEALPFYEMASRLGASRPEQLNNWGVALRDAGRAEEALVVFDRAVATQPDFARAHNNRGNALRDLGRLDDALGAYERAVHLDPNNLLAKNNLAQLLATLGRDSSEGLVDLLATGDNALAAGQAEAALRCYDQHLRALPDDTHALNGRGAALILLKRLDEAAQCLRQLLRIDPSDASAHNNLGNALNGLDQPEQALAHYSQAVELVPENSLFWVHRAQTLMATDQHEAAIPCLQTALALAPDLPHVLGNLVAAKRAVCDWTDLDRDLSSLADAVTAGRPALTPFQCLVNFDDPQLHALCAQQYAQRMFPPAPALFRPGAARSQHPRIRVGYLSADFHAHATSYLMAGLFEHHNREHFEVRAYSFGPDRHDAMRQRLMNAIEHFEDVRHLDDAALARLLLAHEIDILVDLKGYTHLGRTGVLAYRPAPIQVSWIGYPGTLGSDCVDYVIADQQVLPTEQQALYSEHIVTLPGCYQVNDDQRPIAVHQPNRSELELPPDGFVFCCFNNSSKFSPAMFDIWMRLLAQVPGSVLWLLADFPIVEANLRKEAQARGIDPQRLVFAPRLPNDQHLARLAQADLFLDTLPYNAHTTASDALWAGVPVLTCQGQAFAGRVAASLLINVGLPELVTDTLAGYEALALHLAREPQGQLATLRQRLLAARSTCPLFDTPRFTQHLETAYQAMWQRHEQGLAPSAFEVPAAGLTPANGSLANP